jgi:hypothetical protein
MRGRAVAAVFSAFAAEKAFFGLLTLGACGQILLYWYGGDQGGRAFGVGLLIAAAGATASWVYGFWRAYHRDL